MPPVQGLNDPRLKDFQVNGGPLNEGEIGHAENGSDPAAYLLLVNVVTEEQEQPSLQFPDFFKVETSYRGSEVFLKQFDEVGPVAFFQGHLMVTDHDTNHGLKISDLLLFCIGWSL
jgi:hypothetical protein